MALIAILGVIGVATLVVLDPFWWFYGLSRSRTPARRTICGTRMAGIYKSLYVYSETNKRKFPTYPTKLSTGVHPAFTGSITNELSTVPTRAELQHNITATLWTLVKIGETSGKSYLCPSDPDAYIDPQLNTRGNPISFNDESWDFSPIKGESGTSLSFSVMDMYDPKVAHYWDPNVGADWVFMADDNNSDGTESTPGALSTALHEGTRPLLDSDKWNQLGVEDKENSSHHKFKGQNILYGDGHVNFENNPFQGPSGDNIYAVGPPTASRNVPKLTASPTHDKKDVYLVPITGNVGGDSTLHPYD